MQPPKTIDDLPKFLVSDVTHGEPSETGYIDFKLHGVFDQTVGVREGRCWLLLPERNCLVGDLESLNVAARIATFNTSEKEELKAKGRTFPYLAGYWNAYHVWMVTEPQWKWKEVTFLPSDAIAERLPADDSTVGGDGQPIKEWTRVRKIGNTHGNVRVYPVNSQGESDLQAISPEVIIPSGWDHEHCELCNGHINTGEIAYIDLGKHWVCKVCYPRYVSTHDLSFLL
jgi:hypothetical protein